jgi:hypothetical protein
VCQTALLPKGEAIAENELAKASKTVECHEHKGKRRVSQSILTLLCSVNPTGPPGDASSSSSLNLLRC